MRTYNFSSHNKRFEFRVLSGVVLDATQQQVWIKDERGQEHQLKNTQEVPMRKGETISEFILHFDDNVIWYAFYKNNTKNWEYLPKVFTEQRQYLFGYVINEIVKMCNIHPVAIFFAPGLLPLIVLKYFSSNQPNVNKNKEINALIESAFLKLLESLN